MALLLLPPNKQSFLGTNRLEKQPISTTEALPGGATPRAVVHVDADGAREIYAAHGWSYPHADPLFTSGVENLLNLFGRNRIQATFFVIADNLNDPRRRDILKEIVRQGHEIGSHTLTHPVLTSLTRQQKRREIEDSRKLIEDQLGVPVEGFRAPGFLIDRECIEILGECGYRYDASSFPTETFCRRLQVPMEALYAPGRPFGNSSLMELPLPDYRPAPFPTHPSYSLIFGLRYFKWGLQRSRRRGNPFLLLFHLTDAADPLPGNHLNGWKQRVFTMSIYSAARKMIWCQKALDLVKGSYQVTGTSAMIRVLGMPAAKGSAA